MTPQQPNIQLNWEAIPLSSICSILSFHVLESLHKISKLYSFVGAFKNRQIFLLKFDCELSTSDVGYHGANKLPLRYVCLIFDWKGRLEIGQHRKREKVNDNGKLLISLSVIFAKLLIYIFMKFFDPKTCSTFIAKFISVDVENIYLLPEILILPKVQKSL